MCSFTFERVKDVSKLELKWSIYNWNEDYEERYCHNCGKKVIFKDSLKRRQNANGNDIYEFAIYKCEKGHTWNKKLGTFKSNEYEAQEEKTFGICETKTDDIFLEQLTLEGITEIEILLEHVEGSYRLDKLLSEHIKDLSRSQIEKLIKSGAILLNEEIVKTKALVKKAHIIKWML